MKFGKCHGKIRFSLECSNDKYTNDYEVEKGTTWKQFFDNNFPNIGTDWLYRKGSGAIALFVGESGSVISVEVLKDKDGNQVTIEQEITSGAYKTFEANGAWQSDGALYGFFGNP